MPCGKVKLKVEDEDEKDDEDNSGSGDNGESKLVFVLRSRHEALVGTMGDPAVLKCYSGHSWRESTVRRCQYNYIQRQVQ